MREYQVLEGNEIHENGENYIAGDTFFTTPYRAEQLGLGTKIKEVITVGGNTTDTGSDKLTVADREAIEAEIKILQAKLAKSDSTPDKPEEVFDEVKKNMIQEKLPKKPDNIDPKTGGIITTDENVKTAKPKSK